MSQKCLPPEWVIQLEEVFYNFNVVKWPLSILCALLFLAHSLQAQIYTFDHLGIENGMSQNQVNAIARDDYGFMWFGTWDGLNRYDGYNFKVYKHRAFDTSSLSSNFITELLNDSRGRLWIGTNGGGLNLYRPESESFLNLKFNPLEENSISNNGINAIYEDSSGRIWVATQFGLNLIKMSDESIYPQINQFFFQNPHLRSGSNVITDIIELKKDHFLIATDKGLIGLNYEIEDAFSYTFIRAFGKEKENHFVTELFMDSLLQIWVGTKKALYRSNIKSPDFSFSLKPILKEKQNIFESGIQFINQDAEGQIWIGTLNGKLYLSKNEQSTDFREISNENSRTSHHNVLVYNTFFQAPDEEILWIGTDIDGAKKLTLSGRNFENIIYTGNRKKGLVNAAVFSVYVDKKGNKWFGTRKGFSIRESGTQTFHNYLEQNNKLKTISNKKIRAFEEDQFGNLWIGSVNGLSCFRWKNGDPSRLEDFLSLHFDESNANKFGLKSTYIYDIHLDQRNILWIATNEGLYKWIPETKTFEELIYLPADYYDKNVFNIKAIYEDHSSNLWLCTSGGLHRLSFFNRDIEFGHFFHDPLNKDGICSNDINHITQDDKGHYWIATAHGLNKLSFADGHADFTYFGYDQGLPNEYLYSVFSDKNGDLWMSSNLGIISFDPEEKTFRNFVYGDGILNNEFNVGAFHKTAEGKIFFGGIDGITSFYPEQVKENKHLPRVHITGVRKFDKEIYSFRDWLKGKELSFDHDESNIIVEFVAIDYTNPDKNQYAYKLKNKEKSWIYLGNQRSVNFSELKPGNYTLQVKGSNNNGIWNEDYVELGFQIQPPFWQRAEFILITLIIIGVSFYLFYRKKVKDKVKHALEVEQIRNSLNEKVRKKAAADFHDEMGHYLTRINILTEILKQRMKSSRHDLSGIVNSIGEQSQKLYNGTRDFIWTINPDNNYVHELAIRLKDFGDELTLDTEINFNVYGINDSLKENVLTSDFARHLVLIFKEAINNSVRHSGAKNIELSFEKIPDSNIPIVTLSDDGQGIRKEENDFGNGLQNMKKRARKIAADLIISANTPKGTSIKLIPYDYKSKANKTA